MKPALVFPFNDPDGTMFPLLQAILPDLKGRFDRAFITIPKNTQERQPGNVRLLEGDDFFRLFSISSEASVGDHFAFLYRQAATVAHPEQILHLCLLDRLAWAREIFSLSQAGLIYTKDQNRPTFFD